MLEESDQIRIVPVGSCRFVGEILDAWGGVRTLPYPGSVTRPATKRGYPGLTHLETVGAIFNASLIDPPRLAVLEFIAPVFALCRDGQPQLLEVAWLRHTWASAVAAYEEEASKVDPDRRQRCQREGGL